MPFVWQQSPAVSAKALNKMQNNLTVAEKCHLARTVNEKVFISHSTSSSRKSVCNRFCLFMGKLNARTAGVPHVVTGNFEASAVAPHQAGVHGAGASEVDSLRQTELFSHRFYVPVEQVMPVKGPDEFVGKDKVVWFSELFVGRPRCRPSGEQRLQTLAIWVNPFELVFPAKAVREQGRSMRPMDRALAWRAGEILWVRQDGEPRSSCCSPPESVPTCLPHWYLRKRTGIVVQETHSG